MTLHIEITKAARDAHRRKWARFEPSASLEAAVPYLRIVGEPDCVRLLTDEEAEKVFNDYADHRGNNFYAIRYAVNNLLAERRAKLAFATADVSHPTDAEVTAIASMPKPEPTAAADAVRAGLDARYATVQAADADAARAVSVELNDAERAERINAQVKLNRRDIQLAQNAVNEGRQLGAIQRLLNVLRRAEGEDVP